MNVLFFKNLFDVPAQLQAFSVGEFPFSNPTFLVKVDDLNSLDSQAIKFATATIVGMHSRKGKPDTRVPLFSYAPPTTCGNPACYNALNLANIQRKTGLICVS